jgi:hypothetical protein
MSRYGLALAAGLAELALLASASAIEAEVMVKTPQPKPKPAPTPVAVTPTEPDERLERHQRRMAIAREKARQARLQRLAAENEAARPHIERAEAKRARRLARNLAIQRGNS